MRSAVEGTQCVCEVWLGGGGGIFQFAEGRGDTWIALESSRVRSGILPLWMLWAACTICEPSAWRKISRRSTTGMAPELMAAESTVPGPTGGSWSTSPRQR